MQNEYVGCIRATGVLKAIKYKEEADGGFSHILVPNWITQHV